jgi:hypothetical protein
MPKLIYTIGELLAVREVLKSIAPTLYDKVVDIAIGRIFAEIPGSLSNNPIVIARFVGGTIVKLGKVIWLRNFASLASWFAVLGEIIFAGVRSVPGAIKLAVSDHDLVEKLRALGADISIHDAVAIKDEVQKNGTAIKAQFGKIADLAGLLTK